MRIMNYTRAQVRELLESALLVEPTLDTADERADLLSGIQALPLRERRILAWHIMGHPPANIAKREGISRSTAQRLLEAGITHLVERMNGA